MTDGGDGMTIDDGAHGSLWLGGVWMIAVAIALFFLPGLNGLIAGLVGGYRIGEPRRAVGVAVIASIIAAGIGWLLFGVLAMPVLGLAIGAPLAALAIGGMLIGAGIGGVLADREPARARPV